MFDCFGVVYAPILDNWYRKHRLNRGLEDKNIKNIFRQYDLGLINGDDVAEYFSKYEGVNSTKEEIIKEFTTMERMNNDLMDIIRKLKQKGFKTVLLTNSNDSFFESEIYPKHPDFKSSFDEIIISSVVGMVKPNADIFLYALNKTNSQPKETLFIDDNKENVEAAKKLGINGFIYTDTTSFADYIKKLKINI